MSTLKANKLQPYSGDTVIITNNTVVTGSVTATGGFIGSLTGTATNATTATTATNAISASVATTALTALTSITATTAATASNITPVIASDGVNRILTSDGDGTITAEANLTFNGSNLTILGSTTSSGDISFSTLGSSVVQTLTTLGANGTASYAGFSNTTASLNFGLNLIDYAASQDYCVKLPQPVTGKSVTVVNKSGIDIKVFPSNVGGDINGNINGFEVVPSNGTSYVFNCYENPLPGGWSVLSTSGTTQILTSEVISGSISVKTYPAAGWENTKPNFVFINNTLKASGSSFAGIPPQFNFLVPTFDPQYQVGDSSVYNNPYINSRQFPTDSWRRINSVTLITNLTGSIGVTSQIQWNMSLGFDTHFYFASDPSLRYIGGFWDNNTGSPNVDPVYTNWKTNIQIPWATANDGNGYPLQTGYGGSGNGPVTSTVSITPGTFTAGGASPYLAANAGDPGTAKFTINLPQQYMASFFGHTDLGARYISSFTPNQYYYNGTSYVPVGLLDAYSVKCWGIGMYNNSTVFSFPDLKISPQYNVTLN